MEDKKCCAPEFNEILMTNKKMHIVSAVALIDKDRRILINKRPEGKIMSGLWEFPGGKVKEGESTQAAAVREIYEEIGVKICAGCLTPIGFSSYSYTNFHLLVTLFSCYTWEGLAFGKEGQELNWIKISEIYNFEMPEPNKALISSIRAMI